MEVDLLWGRKLVIVAKESKQGGVEDLRVIDRCDRAGGGQLVLGHDHPSSPQVHHSGKASYSRRNEQSVASARARADDAYLAVRPRFSVQPVECGLAVGHNAVIVHASF